MPYKEGPLKFKVGDIVECPGCHTTVVVPSDKSCPACLCDMATAIDDGMRRLQVGDHQWLPPICAGCGDDTEGFRALELGRSQSDGVSPFLKAFIALISPLTALFLPSSSHVSIEVNLPLCPKCDAPIRPEHVNFDHGCVTLLVHHRLKTATAERYRGTE